MRFTTTLGLAAALSTAQAHTVFTTLFVNDQNQGDGTCIRMPKQGSTCTSPLEDLSSPDMACGRDGATAVSFTCPADAGSKLTFEFREYADPAYGSGSIDPSHKGPCAVYLKQVDDITSSPAAGDGWFKIWESGYDEQAGKWCTEKLIANNGLLSVQLPTALPTGYFLVRPELLALHAATKGDPQFYAGCAQVFISGTGTGKLDIPSNASVSIPGYVSQGEESVAFNIYSQPLALPYPIPGPEVYFPVLPSSSPKAKVVAAKQTTGVIPTDCLLKNANWCGLEVPSYTNEDGCWASSEACWKQNSACYDSAPPSGAANCKIWETKCKGIQDACAAKNFNGPPTMELKEVQAAVPGAIPGAEGVSGTEVKDVPAPVADVQSTTAGAAATSVAAPSVVASSVAAASSAAAPSVVAAEPSVSVTTVAAAKPTASSSSGLVISVDGLCGGSTGQTCSGSEFGGCCSHAGQCGTSKLHCGCGCQKPFGQCN